MNIPPAGENNGSHSAQREQKYGGDLLYVRKMMSEYRPRDIFQRAAAT